jgi:hypothetical protein
MFYDLLVKAKLLNDEKIPKFDGTAFSDYFFFESDKEFWKLNQDFENCIPPYERLWVEFKAPKAITSKEKGTNPWDSKRPIQWGWLIESSNGKAEFGVKEYEELNKTHLLSGRIFHRYRNGRMNASKFILHLLVNKEGRIIPFPSYDREVLVSGPQDIKLTEKETQDLIDDFATMFQPALLMIASLCNLDGNCREMLV